MSYTKTFLSGAAVCALATAPAVAAHSNITLAAPKGFVGTHVKTHISDPHNGKNASTFVTTVHETFTLAESTAYLTNYALWGWTWVGSATTCTPLPHQKLHVGLAKHGTTGKFTSSATVSCGSGHTGFGPVYFGTYELTSTTAKKDHFNSKLVYKSKGGFKAILKIPTKLHFTH